MIDFSNRRFTIRIGRSGKPLKNGEQLNRRTSVVGRRTSTRRVSVRNSTALRRAPSGAGGLQRGASVRRSQSGVRRGASVKRAPSAARRTSRRISTLVVEGAHQPPSAPTTSTNDPLQSPTTEVTSPQVTSPTSPVSSKSFFSKLTSRFRGRSKTPKYQPDLPTPLPVSTAPGPPNGIIATLSAGNLAPITTAPPRSPSLRSPSPGSRVTFVDTPIEPVQISDTMVDSVDPGPGSAHAVLTEVSAQPEDIVASPVDEVVGGSDDEGEWVDAEDDYMHLEPHIIVDAESGVPAHASSAAHQHILLGPGSEEAQDLEVLTPAEDPLVASEGARLEHVSEAQPKKDVQTAQLQVSLLDDLSCDGVGARVSQWLAVTPAVVVGEVGADREEQNQPLVDVNATEAGITTVSSKRESKQRPRPPQIIVPVLGSNNPYRVPLPPSPLPSNLSSGLTENNPFRSLVSNESGLLVGTSIGEEFVPPPSPSILLTPADQFDDLDGLDFTRRSSDTLTTDAARFPLPPSPAPSNISAVSEGDAGSILTCPTGGDPTMARTNSMSTSGGRSLSTAPSTRGPATPKSMRFPGHPELAGFTFGGPNSPSLKVEESEDGEERRGRSLEVNEGKRRMRSKSPKLDSVLEGDESRRDSRASVESVGHRRSDSGDKPAISLLPPVEEVVTFGKKHPEDDSESEHEDECGFYAFAERQLVEEKKVESARLDVPKRSKTMSFLSAGFGKWKSTIGDVPPSPTSPNSVSRSATSSRLLGLPTAGPKRSSTLMAPPSGNRTSRLLVGQRSSTLLVDPANQREALSPTMYTAGDIQAAAGQIEDEESRRLSEAAFMF